MNTNGKIFCPECHADSGFEKISRLYRHEKAKENVKTCFGSNYVLEDYAYKNLIDQIGSGKASRGHSASKERLKERAEVSLEKIAPPEWDKVQMSPPLIAVLIVLGLLCAIIINVLLFLWFRGTITMSTMLRRLIFPAMLLLPCLLIFLHFYFKTRRSKRKHWEMLTLWKSKVFCPKCGSIFISRP